MAEVELGALTSQQRQVLATFREIIADAREVQGSVQLLASCNWDVETALQLHWAAGDAEAAPSASASRTVPDLGAPLLSRSAAGGGDGGAAAAGAVQAPAQSQPPARRSMLSWLANGIRRVGATFFSILCSFFFGPGGMGLISGGESGGALSRSLTANYGVELPRFFDGPFSQALSTARQQVKLLVIYLHSENARATQGFVTRVLGNEFVRTMLDDSFLLWGGDVARMESHNLAQMIHTRQYPCFCVLLPASIDEIRVIGMVHGEVEVDQVVALLTGCLDEMDSHRAEIVARREQHAEDRSLRSEQDREYEEALEMDRLREAEQKAEEEKRAEEAARQQAAAAEAQRQAEEAEAQRQAVEARRKEQAAALEAPGADATARISLRLPNGQRIERKFRPTSTLAGVYTWAECCGVLPENASKGIEIPQRFTLKTSFPSTELTAMESTVEELKLAGTMILLSPIEDD
eukprot:gnl/TRDRNA2_/TRDRNA2_185899_c0_seq1.p1 gnl/TRDRNA2_/TRDRNA2_185899_c0~~gnl/TRDRNA2_/TRDRNA2_185899_c0_seq1.p1  ORF type:complete len:500 (-),score=118.63 gnl/TRDRNA2_/TRDRNA2_185899_c0_seq1:150-1541(-)